MGGDGPERADRSQLSLIYDAGGWGAKSLISLMDLPMPGDRAVIPDACNALGGMGTGSGAGRYGGD